VAGLLVVLVGAGVVVEFTSVLVLVHVPFFWSSKLLCAFPTSPSSSVFGRRRLLGPQRVMQLWWVQSLDDLRFFSSAKKEGTVV
jgi:hypothetical protein